MNIIHLQNLGGVGGIAVLTRDIAMVSKENNFFYFTFEGGDIAEQIKAFSPVEIADASHKNLLKEAKRFTGYCKKNGADVIVEHTGTAIGLFSALYAKRALKNAKLIIYWHSNASFFDKRGINGSIEVFLKRLAYKKCDAAAAISNSVKASYLEVYKYKKDKISVVYNGIECKKFYSKRINDPSLPFNIIYVGRVFKPKGIHLLINAINKLSDEIKENIKVKIVGQDRGTYTEQMMEKTKKLGLEELVTFTGMRHDIPDLLSEADLFVHPAICKEGFGITLAEAMAAHVPCAAFNLGAIPEVIDDQINGFIIDAVNSDALAAEIEKAYKLFKYEPEKYVLLRSNARKKAETFSIENTVAALERLYKD